jgi:hypothetical protein
MHKKLGIRCMVELLTSGADLDWDLLNIADAETRILFSQRQTLEEKDGILYRQFVKPDGTLSHLPTQVYHHF